MSVILIDLTNKENNLVGSRWCWIAAGGLICDLDILTRAEADLLFDCEGTTVSKEHAHTIGAHTIGAHTIGAHIRDEVLSNMKENDRRLSDGRILSKEKFDRQLKVNNGFLCSAGHEWRASFAGLCLESRGFRVA